MKKYYPYPTVKEQLSDPDSIVNKVKEANKMRLENPELARGSYETIFMNEDNSFGVCKRSYNNSDIYVLINLAKEGEVSYDISSLGNKEIVSSFCCIKDTKLMLEGDSKLIIPALSITIIR